MDAVGPLFWEVLISEQSLAFRVFLSPVVVQRQVPWEYRPSLGSSSCVSLLWRLGEFHAFLARAVHTWNLGAFFRRGVVSGSHMSCVWVLPVNIGNEFFERFCGYSCAMLGSTVDTCSATVRFGRIAHNFYSRRGLES